MKTVNLPNVMNIYLAGLCALKTQKKAVMAAFPTLAVKDDARKGAGPKMTLKTVQA